LRSTSAIDACASITTVTAGTSYSSVQLGGIEPILASRDEFGQLIPVPPNGERSSPPLVGAGRGGASKWRKGICLMNTGVAHGEHWMGLALIGVLAVGRTGVFDLEASLANA
jgi:hypothetical protein